MADQWRADCLGFSGHPAVETPYLDGLFRDGVSFSRAYTACPTCIPARVALWTGLTPETHGRNYYRDGEAWDYPNFLPETLAAAGYHTQMVGKMHVDPPRKLLGFHNVVLHDGTLTFHRMRGKDYRFADDYSVWLKERVGADVDVTDTGLGANSFVVNPWPYEERYHPTNWVASEAIDFLRRRDTEKPFFLTASFVRPHPPLDPPLHYLQRYLDKDLPEPAMGDWAETEDPTRQGLSPDFVQTGCIDPPQARRARAAYFALITHVDQQIGRILNALRWEGVLDDTLIVFVSDHGELLGDHNMWNKAMAYEGSARVPLLVRPPMSWDCPRGQELDPLVELRDLFPTFCEAVAVDPPSTVEGQSILPFCRDKQSAETSKAPWRESLRGGHQFGARTNEWVTDGDWKYIVYPQTGEEQLFHLAEDPKECRNLIASEPDHAKRLRVLLQAAQCVEPVQA
jgi:arylsulfatase A-like enzyme